MQASRVCVYTSEWVEGGESAGLGVVESCPQVVVTQVEIVGLASEEVGNWSIAGFVEDCAEGEVGEGVGGYGCRGGEGSC